MNSGFKLAIVFVILTAKQSFAQSIPVKTAPDSLIFSVTQICYDSVRKTLCRVAIAPELVYDFTYQYPFYRLKEKAWRPGDRFQLQFTRLPSTGTIYIFSLDGNNTPTILPLIRIDSTVRLPLTYPDDLKGLTFETEGTEYISLWYASDSITHAEKLMKGIELTMGPIVKRNNRQLGKNLLLPNYGWHFDQKQFGFIIEPALHELPARFIIPIILETKVIGKTNRKKRVSKKTKSISSNSNTY